ncbi:MAG: hypothetical protein ACRDS0_24315 [Pseudonocardiaceae bacterium]
MPDTLSIAELDAQHVELLPSRTVLSLMLTGGHNNVGDNSANGGNGGIAIAVNAGNINFGGDQTNVAVADAHGGNGGNINQFVWQKYVHIHHR